MRFFVYLAAGAWVTAVGLGCAHAQKQVTEQETAPPAPVAKATAPEKEVTPSSLLDAFKGTVLHFDYDAASLTQESQELLLRVADALRKEPRVKIRIAGNCDERGTEEYNLALGQRRAASAKKYLVRLGVSEERVDAVTFGDERPLDPGHSEAAWAANRRDEIEPVASR